jgi:hypothetical protein
VLDWVAAVDRRAETAAVSAVASRVAAPSRSAIRLPVGSPSELSESAVNTHGLSPDDVQATIARGIDRALDARAQAPSRMPMQEARGPSEWPR